MSAILRPSGVTHPRPVLHNGDRMTREEFHRIYEQMPEDFRAELIGGIVYVSPALRLPHGTNHLPLGTVFFLYKCGTPGIECGDNTTILLGDEGEPQPDLFLRILPEFGRQSKSEDGYVVGPPELVAEIAHSSRALDLHAKRMDYARYGVREYLVLCVAERELRCFDLVNDTELSADADGVLRLLTFPGLWIHRDALLAQDGPRLVSTLNQGLQ